MPKVGMPEIRKPQLIEAAIKAIDKYGFAGATVSVIGKKAGSFSSHHQPLLWW